MSLFHKMFEKTHLYLEFVFETLGKVDLSIFKY